MVPWNVVSISDVSGYEALVPDYWRNDSLPCPPFFLVLHPGVSLSSFAFDNLGKWLLPPRSPTRNNHTAKSFFNKNVAT